MLLNGNGSSGESCTKRSDGHSSGTSSPHSDPNQSFNTQSKANLGYPSFPPPGTNHSFSLPFSIHSHKEKQKMKKKTTRSKLCNDIFFQNFIANWTEFLPPPPEHPPPLPLANCVPMGMCYVPTSPGSMRRAAAQWAGSGLANHQK